MKLLEIFYLLVIFNVFMAIFGNIPLSNGHSMMSPSPGSATGFDVAEDPEKGISVIGIADFGSIMAVLIGALAGLYAATTFVGNEKTPMAAIYGFGIVFQVVYVACWFSFWHPLIALIPHSGPMDEIIGAIGVLFTFLVESIFVIGFIQMTTGGMRSYL